MLNHTLTKKDIITFLKKGLESGEITNNPSWGICLKGDPEIYKKFDTAKKHPSHKTFKDAIKMVRAKYSRQGFSDDAVEAYSEYLVKDKSIQNHLTTGNEKAIELLRRTSGKKKKMVKTGIIIRLPQNSLHSGIEKVFKCTTA
jgi:hypothetical protein